MTQTSAQQLQRIEPTARLRIKVIVGSALIFSLPLVDIAFGAVGKSLQFVLLAAAILLLRSSILRAVSDRRCMAALLVIALVALVGIGVGDRLSLTAPTGEFGLRLILFVSLAFVLGVIVATTPEFRPSFVTGIALAGAISATIVALGLASDTSHVETGRSIAVGLTVLPFLQTFRSRSLLARFALLGFLAITAFQTGARAPVVFSITSIVVVLVFLRSTSAATRREANRWRFLAAGIAVLVTFGFASGFIQLENLKGASARQAEFLEARSLRDVDSFRLRLDDLYAPAAEMIENNLVIGRGLPADVEVVDGYQYPHNFVLEMGVGFGLFGVVAAGGILILAFRGVWGFLRTDPAVSALIVYVVLSAQVSDDVVGNRMMFFAAACGLFLRRKDIRPSRDRAVSRVT